MYFIVFLEEHYRFCSVFYECISIDASLVTILIHDIIVMIGLLMQ